MTIRQKVILVATERFGYWCMRCGDVLVVYSLLGSFFPVLTQRKCSFLGEIAFASALGFWMIAWLMLILKTGCEKRFKKSP